MKKKILLTFLIIGLVIISGCGVEEEKEQEVQYMYDCVCYNYYDSYIFELYLNESCDNFCKENSVIDVEETSKSLRANEYIRFKYVINVTVKRVYIEFECIKKCEDELCVYYNTICKKDYPIDSIKVSDEDYYYELNNTLDNNLKVDLDIYFERMNT